MLASIDTATSALPPSFDLRAYREHNPGLAAMTDEELAYHYQAHGQREGRVCSQLHDRASLLRVVSASAKILEIGPSWRPVIHRPDHDVTYVDVYDTDELRRQAAAAEPAGDDAAVPEIDHVWVGDRYRDMINMDFDVVVSCHNIGHQPNLIGHLRDVAAVLRPSGMFVLVVPDQRYGAGYFLPPSDISGVLEAHGQDRIRHSMASVIADQMMQTHRVPLRHWTGDHGPDPRFDGPSEARTQCILQAMAYQDAGEGYVDAEAWHFTPDSFAAIMTELQAIKMVPLQVARIYPTVFGASEFYALVQKR